MVSRKSVRQHAARTHLANFLHSIGDVPVAASARAAAMRECASERRRTQNIQDIDRGQHASATSQLPGGEPSASRTRADTGPLDPEARSETHLPSGGEPSTSRTRAGWPLDLEAHNEQDSADASYEHASAYSSEPTLDTAETGRHSSGRIQPDPIEDEPDSDDEGPRTVIHLPDLQTTQDFIDALGTASLESSGLFAHFDFSTFPLAFPGFPSVPHPRAALPTLARPIKDRGGYLREVSRPAEACMTISDHY
ncbi:hypothetical protein H4582DRAFT_2093490 [Lactarius indigo]|nr:hypothetical protein H4582DRAFT_2093490 [Lactarius indigo]